MLGLITLFTMLFGTAVAPLDDQNASDQEEDSLPEDWPDPDPDLMADGGLLAFADDDDDQAGDSKDDLTDILADPAPAPQESWFHDGNEAGGRPEDQDAAKPDVGLTKGLAKVSSDVGEVVTDKDIIKDLKDQLKDAKGSLDKDVLKSLKDELHELKGSAKSEVLTADALGSFLQGLEGNDRLVGGAGTDVLEGGDDDDSLRATEGGDVMLGGGGSDILIGVESSYDPALGLHQFIHGKSGPSEDILDGGDGDDVLRIGRGDTAIGGSGADLFFVEGQVDDPLDDIVPVITDFTPGEDDLVIAIPYSKEELIASWPDLPDRHFEIETQNFEDGTGATIYVNGQVMAHVTGAQNIDPADVRIVGNEMVGADWFDISHGVQASDTWWNGINNDAAANAIRSGTTR